MIMSSWHLDKFRIQSSFAICVVKDSSGLNLSGFINRCLCGSFVFVLGLKDRFSSAYHIR